MGLAVSIGGHAPMALPVTIDTHTPMGLAVSVGGHTPMALAVTTDTHTHGTCVSIG